MAEGEVIDSKVLQMMQQRLSAMQDNLVKFQLDAAPELEEFKRSLLGYEINEDGDWQQMRAPVMNSDIINHLFTFLSPQISKIATLSNIDDDSIRQRSLDFMNAVSFFLFKQMFEHNIIDFNGCNMIIETCDNLFNFTANKAHEGWEGDSIRKQFTHVESQERITEQRPQNKLPFPIPFGGK